MEPQQCADAVLMIEPKTFGYNSDTALTNTFQRPESHSSGADMDGADRDSSASVSGVAKRVSGLSCSNDKTPRVATRASSGSDRKARATRTHSTAVALVRP